MDSKQPVMLLLAGPNGAGKTTVSEYVLDTGVVSRFINADTIAKGLTSGSDAAADIEAGRIMILAVEEAIEARESFSLETTLSGRNWLPHIARAKELGFRVEVWYVKVDSAETAISRVRERAAKGGHFIEPDVIRRRFERSWRNLCEDYRHQADQWYLFDNSGGRAIMVGTGRKMDMVPGCERG